MQEAPISFFYKVVSRIRVILRALFLSAVRSVRWILKPTLKKTINVLAAVIMFAIAIVILAVLLRFLHPKTIIQVSAVELFSSNGKTNIQGGKALADMVVDDVHQIIEEASRFSGNSFASKKSYPPLPDLPKIPVDTTYGIDIKGISLDQIVATWKHLRYREFRISGDLIVITDNQFKIKLRYEAGGRANSFEIDSSPATIENDLRAAAFNVLSEISPETVERYLFQKSVTCASECVIDQDEALRFCWSWLVRQPENASALNCIGYNLADSRYPTDALPFLDRSIRLYQQEQHFWERDRSYLPMNSKGFVYMRVGQYQEAAAIFKQVLRLRRSPTAMLNLGVVAMRQGDYSEAENWYRKSLKVDPNYIGALANLGHLLIYKSRYGEAEVMYRRILELDPGREDGRFGIALAVAGEGRFNDALLECDREARLHMDEESIVLNKAMIFVWERNPDDAIKLLGSNPRVMNTLEGRFQLILAYVEKHDLETAKKIVSGALESDPRNLDWEYAMAKILEQEGDLEGAKVHLNEVQTRGPGFIFDSLHVQEFSRAVAND